MTTKKQHLIITEGVAVSVNTMFRADISNVRDGVFFYHYNINIENRNDFPVQLLHRDWFIFDSLHASSHVSGEGVIGQQPVLAPGEVYNYTSGCEIRSDVGAMTGFYTFINKENEQVFRVEIPTFHLLFPGKLN